MEMTSGASWERVGQAWEKFEIRVVPEEDFITSEGSKWAALGTLKRFIVLREACEFFVTIEKMVRLPTSPDCTAWGARVSVLRDRLAGYLKDDAT